MLCIVKRNKEATNGTAVQLMHRLRKCVKFSVLSKYYGGLNDVCPHRLIYSNAWSPVGGTLREELVRAALLEKVCQLV